PRPLLYVLTVADGVLRRIATPFVENRAPAWSPDGKSITFGCSKGRREQHDVSVIPAEGGAVRNLTTASDLDPTDPSWAPPRRYLLVPERRWLAYRGVPDAPSRLSPGEDLSPDPLHSRWPALELRQRILPRVPAARGTGVLGAAGEPARLYRIRPRVHVRQPGALGAGGLRG